MATLLNIALINAVTVLPLSLLACMVGRLARRPALTHALWVLVLAKFVTPPLFNLPMTIDVPVANRAIAEPGASLEATTLVHDAQTDLGAGLQDSRTVVAINTSRVDPSREQDQRPPDEVAVSATNPTSVKADRTDADQRVRAAGPAFFQRAMNAVVAAGVTHPSVQSLLLGGWLAGVALWAVWQSIRAMRFHRRVLRGAVASSEVQEQTQQLAAKLGLRRAPQVLIVDAAVSPMLWGCGSRAKLLFPSDLAARLDDEARATLLTHELAHFSRGDHWVRLLELIVTGFFWWHPVVWWARQEIEQSEEECCDAWVVGAFPNTPRHYAEALLDTIDFLCESRQPLPPVACGLGQAHFLRHRLTKIMRGVAPKALSQRIRFAIALVAALLLPLQPFVFGSASAPSIAPVALSPGEPVGVVDRPQSGDPNSEVTSLELPPVGKASAEQTALSSKTRRMRGEKDWSTAASADGRFLVRVTTARRVLLTDRFTNGETDLSSHGITAVAFVPDRLEFVATGSDGRVTLWDSVTGEWTRVLHVHDDALRTVSVSPRGDVVAVGGKTGDVLLLDFATGATLAELPRQSMAVNCVRFSPDARSLAVAVGDWESNNRGQIILFDVVTRTTGTVLDCESTPGAVTFASNGDLIVGLWNGQADLWNLESRRLVGTAQANKSIVAAASFSPDNPVLREVDFVASRPVATDDESDSPLWEAFFGGLRP